MDYKFLHNFLKKKVGPDCSRKILYDVLCDDMNKIVIKMNHANVLNLIKDRGYGPKTKAHRYGFTGYISYDTIISDKYYELMSRDKYKNIKEVSKIC